MFNNSMSAFYAQKDEKGITNRKKIETNQQVIRRIETDNNPNDFEKVLYKSDGVVIREGRFIGFGINISNSNVYPPLNFEIYLRNCDLVGELDLSDKPDMLFIDVFHNRISKINLKNSSAIKVLGLQDNILSELDISDLAQCQGVDAGYNRISEIDVSKNSELIELYVNNNKLKNIDLSGCPKLNHFYCHENEITKLDTRFNPELENLNATENPMKEIYSTAPKSNGALPLQLFAENGGYVGLRFTSGYNYRQKNSVELDQRYFAMPEEGFSFDGWYAPNGEVISKKAIFEDTYGTSRILTARFIPETNRI